MSAITFDLEVAGAAAASLAISRFRGEEQLSRPYRFDLAVTAAEDGPRLDQLLGQQARLTLTRQDSHRVIHGLIAEGRESGEASGGTSAYRLALVPRLALLGLSRHQRSFGTDAPMSVLDVVQAVLADPDGLAMGAEDWCFRRLERDNYPARDFWAQYDESDFDFLHRHLEHWGIFYFFEQTPLHERIVFCDEASRTPHQRTDHRITFTTRQTTLGDDRGYAHAVTRQVRLVPKTVQIKDYNDETPHHVLQARRPVPHGQAGIYSEYAPHVRDDAEADLIAHARADELASGFDIFEIETDSPFLAPGYHLTMSDHLRTGFNQSYFPTEIRHEGAQPLAEGFAAPKETVAGGYRNTVTAIPSSSPYRSPRRLRRPVMAGIMPATVEAPEGHGDRARLDAQGRYRIAIDFDSAEKPVFQRSAAVRMAQPYGGPNMGLHLPLRDGSPVMVGWVDGDPDRPLIMGAVPNARATSPVTQQNHTQNKLSTPSGIAIVMNDGPGQADHPHSGSGAGEGGQGGHGRAHQAAASHTPTSSVYTSFKVPADGSSLPHYWRVGDIAPADGHEPRILGSSTFQAGSATNRDPSLSSSSYSGFFGFTPHHHTMTVGGNANSLIQGNHSLRVNGSSYHAFAGPQHVDAYIAQGGGGVGAEATPLYQKMELVNNLFAIESFCVPRYEFFNGMKMEYMNGWNVEYGIGQKLEAFLDFFGTFEHRAGAQVTLSGLPKLYETEWTPSGVGSLMNPLQIFKKPMGSSYNISMSGYSYKQISGVDKDHRIFGANSVTIGYRPVAGTAAMTALTEAATVATLISALSAVAANGAQPFAYAAALNEAGVQDVNKGDWEDIVTEAIEIAAAAGLGMSYIVSLAAILAYHLTGAKALALHDAVALADPIASTLALGKTGATLQFGNPLTNGSVLSMKPAEFGLSMGPSSGIIIDLETVTIMTQNVEIIAAQSVAISSAGEVTVEAPAIAMTGAVHVDGSLAITGPVTATGNIAGNVFLAGI